MELRCCTDGDSTLFLVGVWLLGEGGGVSIPVGDDEEEKTGLGLLTGLFLGLLFGLLIGFGGTQGFVWVIRFILGGFALKIYHNQGI